MNGKTHKTVGVVAGAATAVVRSGGQRTLRRAVEAVGGGLGGYVGAALPDLLEPAISPRHRGVGHSFTAGTGIVAAAAKHATTWERSCRSKADALLARTDDPNTDGVERFMCLLGAVLLLLAAGLLSGFAAGYVSHLALDATTPRSLPLLSPSLV
ncbi:MAG: metal-dependent hydrolase [Polyangia bacterium]|jgi:membrane-bound metal-dependent hydrolase YbcI (DUF457 family)